MIDAQTQKQIEEIREPVRWFAAEMEKTLKANDHKNGWLDCDPHWLRDRIHEELHELHYEMLRVEIGLSTYEKVIREATDVANFAMMIADIARRKLGVLE